MAVPVKYLKKTRTEPALKAALLSRMETKPLAKITIKELCEIADVYRSTFYCHYNDVESLYDALEKDILAQVDKTFEAYSARKLTTYEYCRALCEMIKNGNLDLSVLFRLDNCDSKAFYDKLVERIINQVKTIYADLENGEFIATILVTGAISCVVRMPDATSDEVTDAIMCITRKLR